MENVTEIFPGPKAYGVGLNEEEAKERDEMLRVYAAAGDILVNAYTAAEERREEREEDQDAQAHGWVSNLVEVLINLLSRIHASRLPEQLQFHVTRARNTLAQDGPCVWGVVASDLGFALGIVNSQLWQMGALQGVGKVPTHHMREAVLAALPVLRHLAGEHVHPHPAVKAWIDMAAVAPYLGIVLAELPEYVDPDEERAAAAVAEFTARPRSDGPSRAIPLG